MLLYYELYLLIGDTTLLWATTDDDEVAITWATDPTHYVQKVMA